VLIVIESILISAASCDFLRMDKEELLLWFGYGRSHSYLNRWAARVGSIARSRKRGIEIEKKVRLARGAGMDLEKGSHGLYHL